jgi:hypothetical protein
VGYSFSVFSAVSFAVSSIILRSRNCDWEEGYGGEEQDWEEAERYVLLACWGIEWSRVE